MIIKFLNYDCLCAYYQKNLAPTLSNINRPKPKLKSKMGGGLKTSNNSRTLLKLFIVERAGLEMPVVQQQPSWGYHWPLLPTGS